MSYIKAHPFGYKPIKNTKSANLSHETHKQEELKRIQTVQISHNQTRVIKHYTKWRRGRTLAEMVYESVMDSIYRHPGKINA